ncbi:MAG: hypothetical protein LBP19_05865 [Treponema sp.]|nr:hypothetical protein [Treponema sp.]
MAMPRAAGRLWAYGVAAALFLVCAAAVSARPAPDMEPTVNAAAEQTISIPAFEEPWRHVAPLSDMTAKIFAQGLSEVADVQYEPLLVTRRIMENGTCYLFACNAASRDAHPYAALVYLYQTGSDVRIADIRAIGHAGMVGSYRAFETPTPEAHASLQAALSDAAEIDSFTPLLTAIQIVAGRNYFFVGNVTRDSRVSPACITVYQPLHDAARITEVNVLSLGNQR